MPEVQLLHREDAARPPRRSPEVAPGPTQGSGTARGAAERPHIVMVAEMRKEYGRPPLIAYAWVLAVGMGLLIGLMLGQHLVLTWR